MLIGTEIPLEGMSPVDLVSRILRSCSLSLLQIYLLTAAKKLGIKDCDALAVDLRFDRRLFDHPCPSVAKRVVEDVIRFDPSYDGPPRLNVPTIIPSES